MMTGIKKTRHKLSLLLLACAIIFASFGPAAVQAEEKNELSRAFSDVSVNWSYKYVSKLALLGVIQGRGNGIFAPNDLVTQQEVLIMAVQMMGISADVVEHAKSNDLPEGLETAEWAKGYVNVAIQQGLVNVEEELFMIQQRKDELDAAWGSWPASREWVAKMTVRAIGKSEQAALLADQEVSFNDAGDITKGFEGYINAAVQLDIVSGMPGNVFKPTDPVTRAQMAVFLSRGEQYMPELSERVMIGTLLDLNEDEITLKLNDGENVTFTLHDTAEFFSYAVNDQPISLDELEPYYEVYVIHHEGDAYYVEVIDDEVEVDTVRGILIELDLQALEAVVAVSGQTRIYSLHPSMSAIDADGRGLSWSALVPHSVVQLTQIYTGDTAEVMEMTLIEAPVNKHSTGLFQSFDESVQFVTFIDDRSGKEESYLLSEQAEIYYGKRKLSIDELKPNDQMAYEIENSVIRQIELIEPVEPLLDLVEGEIRSQITDLVTIINENGQPEAYVVSETVSIELAGLPHPTAEDIVIGDQVILYVDIGSREVKKIEVKNRAIEQISGAEIVSFHEASKSFFIWLPNVAEPRIFKVNDATVFEQRTDLSIEDIQAIFAEGTMVNIKFTNDQLVELALADGYVGVVKQIDTTERKMIMQIDHYGPFEFTYNNLTRFESGKEDGKISDIRTGDRISVHMHPSNHYASRVKLHHKEMVRIIDVNAESNTIYLSHPLGGSAKVELSESLRLTDDQGNNVSLPEVSTYRPIIVSYSGNDITKVQLASYERGQVIDISAHSFVLMNDHNQTIQIPFADLQSVYINGISKEQSFEDLALNDFVEVSTDNEGNRWLMIMTTEEKVFHSFDFDQDLVTFRRATLNEQNTFVTHPDLIVLDQGTPVSVRSLNDRDEVTVYFLDEQIVIIDKK